MYYIYLLCAIIGGTLIVLQFLMGVIGLDHDHDVGGDADMDGGDGDHGDHGTWLAGVITFRTMVAAFAFFGLAGLIGESKGWQPFTTLPVALACGGGALFVVAGMMKSLHKLKSDGTVHIRRAIGKNGTVYLKVPGQKAGSGKVTLNLQNRTVEYQAITAQDDLPTGAKIVVVGIVGPDTVEVELATSTERAAHV